MAKDATIEICANCHCELQDFINYKIGDRGEMSGEAFLRIHKEFIERKKEGWKALPSEDY